jgi:DDB1- and CUL4-associated factor 15
MLQFTASDIEKGKQCYNCSNTLNCLTHCQIYQTQTLFTWNIESGNWNCLDYGQLQLSPSTGSCSGKIYKKTSTPDKTSMMTKLTQLTKTLFDASRLHDNENKYLNHLRILDSCNEKTKDKLIDMDNMIEFYRKSVGDISSSSDLSSNDEDNDSDIESVSDYDSDDD